MSNGEKKKTYCIKPEYEHRTVNATIEDNVGDYWSKKRILTSHYNQYHVYDLALKLIKEHQFESVLDVGCGTGIKLNKIIAGHAKNVTGIDQATVISQVDKFHKDSTVNFVAANFEQPEDSGLDKSDLVMSVDVIEHMSDPDLLLDFIKAHSHKDTYILISTPERDVIRGVDNVKSPRAVHVREWNKAELKAYLESSGLKVVEHHMLPAFKVGMSLHMIKERFRMIRKRRPYYTNQAVVCKLA